MTQRVGEWVQFPLHRYQNVIPSGGINEESAAHRVTQYCLFCSFNSTSSHFYSRRNCSETLTWSHTQGKTDPFCSAGPAFTTSALLHFCNKVEHPGSAAAPPSLGIIPDQWGQFSPSTARIQDTVSHPMQQTLPALGSTLSNVRARFITVSEVLTAVHGGKGINSLKSYLPGYISDLGAYENWLPLYFYHPRTSCLAMWIH